MHVAIFYTLFCASCIYALLRGGGPERSVAIVMIVGVAVTPLVLNPVSARFYGLETGAFILDLAILIAFMVIAVRANRFWPMAVVAFHGMSVLGHLLKLSNSAIIRTAYLVMLAMWIYPQLALLVMGTWRHRARMRARGIDPSWVTSSYP